MYKEGRIPLHTLRADVDYALHEAHTVYGIIGVKVWIFKGEVYKKRDLSPNIGMVSSTPSSANNTSKKKNDNTGGNKRRRK
jgi:small subunit ribosomal protein S3